MATIRIPKEDLEIAQRVLAEITGEEKPKPNSKPCTGCVRNKGPLGCTLVSFFCRNEPTKPHYLSRKKAIERGINPDE